MKMVFNVKDKPKFGQLIVFAIQQLLAIMAATLVVPVIINGNAGLEGVNAMSTAAALFGAGAGTLVYVLFTKGKCPVFLGSSFAFIGSMDGCVRRRRECGGRLSRADNRCGIRRSCLCDNSNDSQNGRCGMD